MERISNKRKVTGKNALTEEVTEGEVEEDQGAGPEVEEDSEVGAEVKKEEIEEEEEAVVKVIEVEAKKEPEDLIELRDLLLLHQLLRGKLSGMLLLLDMKI